jgi:hypothetical protein
MPRTPDVVGILTDHGLAPGPEGFVLADLDAAVAARGWRSEVDERPPIRFGYRVTPQFGAVVFAPEPGRAPRMTRGKGDTAATALAQALAKLLA